jgi:hypothetical protein
VRVAGRPTTQLLKTGPSVIPVSVPTPKNGKTRLWITIAASALVLGIASAVLFWNEPPNSGKRNPKQLQRAAVIPEAEKDSTDIPASYTTDFAAAYQLFASNQFQPAADAFRNVHQNAASDPAAIEWAMLHEGMALTAGGKLQEAQNVFRSLKGRAINPNLPIELQQFLRKVAALAAEPEPPSPNLAPLFNNNNHEAIALLAFGLKCWDMKKFPEALVFFRQFQLARPAGKYAWIARLKPVASRLQDEYTASLMPARPPHETSDSEKPRQKKVVGQKEILTNTIPDDQRVKVSPGIYTLLNFANKKYLAIDSADQSGIKLTDSESHDQPEQKWEIAEASPDKSGVYTLKSVASGKMINFGEIPWGTTRVIDIPTDRSKLVHNWIFASTENDGYYRLVSETALGSISTAQEWEKGAGRNGIEVRIGHFPVSLWKLEKVEKE